MFLTADGAKEFGIIDKVMEKRSEDIGELIAAAKSS
jgi:ATP-dependent protease ClpP protease subunit